MEVWDTHQLVRPGLVGELIDECSNIASVLLPMHAEREETYKVSNKMSANSRAQSIIRSCPPSNE